MKKKLLSIFLSLSLIFSSIASMSVAFAEEPELEKISTEKVVQQDGIEVRMDMKAGSKIKIWTSLNGGNADPENVGEYFDGKEVHYDGWQLMKIDINIPKKDGLMIESIEPSIESLQPNYSKISEDDNGYNYSFYFKKNDTYNFNIGYKLNNVSNNINVEYKVDNLIEIPDVTMRGYFIVAIDPNEYHGYVTKDDIEEGRYYQQDGSFQKNNIDIGAYGGPDGFFGRVSNIEGVQYMKTMRQIKFYHNYLQKNPINAESLEPFTRGYYPEMSIFQFTSPYDSETKVKKSAYTSEMLGKILERMPNLTEFSANNIGFNNFEAFEKMNGKMDFIACKSSGITSIKGLEKHTGLTNLSLNVNEISDLTPLKNVKEATQWNFIQNEISDLRPIKDVKVNRVIHFGFQSIYPEPILATLNNDNYEIEVNMPIDIDGSYTKVGFADFLNSSSISSQVPSEERNQLLVKYPDGNKKVYPINEKDGKACIKIPKVDVPNAGTDKAFENVKMRLWFENDKGDDSRTRGVFNGRIEFGATTKKDKEKATVKYEAKNTSKNRTDVDVDKNILKVEDINVSDYVNLPKDEKEYNVGESVTPKNPTTTKKINEDGEETGVSTEIKPGESVLVKYEVPNTKKETYVELKFEGYEPEKTNLVAGENTFVGKFKFNDLELVHYDFITDEGKEIPKNIEEKIEDEFEKFKEYELYPDGEDVILKQPKNKTIKDTDGTWEFTGWAYKKEDGKYEYVKNNEKEVHHDEELKGVWKFVKDSSGGGTGGGGTITPTPNPNPTPDKEDPDRVEGDDRIETSIEASEILYPNGTNAVVLANAERFSDVLTANPFAVQEKASALLTYKDKLPEKTLKEIERLGAKKIYVSGGYEAVSKKVVDSLAAKGYEIYRFDGLDRYDTARKIAIKIREKGNKEVVELASGENYPDALCMTSMAVKDNAPILLTRKDSIPKYTKQALAEWDIESVKIGGLDEAISKDVQNQIDKGFEITKGNKADSNVYDGAKKVSRFGGKDRYETSTIIAANSYPESKLGVYATGEDFPDALIAGNYAGRKEAPVLLVKGDSLPEPIEKYTKESKIKKATIIGGVNAVSDKVFNLIKAIINR